MELYIRTEGVLANEVGLVILDVLEGFSKGFSVSYLMVKVTLHPAMSGRNQ